MLKSNIGVYNTILKNHLTNKNVLFIFIGRDISSTKLTLSGLRLKEENFAKCNLVFEKQKLLQSLFKLICMALAFTTLRFRQLPYKLEEDGPWFDCVIM